MPVPKVSVLERVDCTHNNQSFTCKCMRHFQRRQMWAGSVVPVSLHSSAKARWKFLFSVPFHSFVKGTWKFPCSFSIFFCLRVMEISMCLYVVLHKGTWKFPCIYLSLLPKEQGNLRVLYPLCKPGNLLHIFFIPNGQGHPTSYFGKYLFGRRFEI